MPRVVLSHHYRAIEQLFLYHRYRYHQHVESMLLTSSNHLVAQESEVVAVQDHTVQVKLLYTSVHLSEETERTRVLVTRPPVRKHGPVAKQASHSPGETTVHECTPVGRD